MGAVEFAEEELIPKIKCRRLEFKRIFLNGCPNERFKLYIIG